MRNREIKARYKRECKKLLGKIESSVIHSPEHKLVEKLLDSPHTLKDWVWMRDELRSILETQRRFDAIGGKIAVKRAGREQIKKGVKK